MLIMSLRGICPSDESRGIASGELLATASFDQTVRLWDTATGQPHGQPLQGHTGPVNDVTFSPDVSLLATASDDKTVGLWDVKPTDPSLVHQLTGHTDFVTGGLCQRSWTGPRG
jgi:WD40 repeat protein